MRTTSVVDRATISDVLRLAGVATVQRGGRVWFQCAVHDDTHPSAVVVGERGWRCHVCGAKGGIFGLTVAFGLAESHASAARFLDARLP
jgi:DNA primase